MSKQCLSCQRIKAERVLLPGKLHPFDIPQMKWEFISMDFVRDLPTVQGGYDSIMVIVDMLTKVSHLIPVKKIYTASDISRLFVKEIFRLHGLPKRIISERDAKFTSKFWKALFEALGTQLCFSLAYHPQSDGQTERVNQVVEDIPRAYCSREPKKWIQFLPLVEFAYNSSFHTSIGMSPFKALYGHECVSPLNFSNTTIRVEATKKMLEEMGERTKAIRQDIQDAKDRQKHYADQKRSYRKFKQGDKVFLRVRQKRSNLSLGKFKKLSPRYCGPYEVIKVLNDQAYKLKLPEHIKVHDVFHISLLKPYIPNPNHVLDNEQIVMQKQGVLELQPDCILETREMTLRNRTIRVHLVKWKDYPTEDATWEDEVSLCKDFPSFC
ncbi:hypothetical protein L7F22_044441 [Adiantum nelumboides]|nr:hypothetical protein [Adiantum nelumboides]